MPSEVWVALGMVVVGYLSGSVMYSRLIARLALKRDLSTVGDGNPGMTNVLRAGGVGWGVLALLLDALKGSVPVGIARYSLGISGWWLVPVALAPMLGHAYPLFWRFRGGKAIAVAGGVWAALTLWEVPTVGGLLLLFWMLSVTNHGWVTVFMALSVLAYLLLTGAPTLFLAVMLGTLALFAWKHRAELRRPPGPGRWVRRVVGLWHPSSSSS